MVPYSDDPVELIQSALAPARVREVRLDDETGTATVIVSDYQLSLAIGKEGQNARLAARLTGWRIDIKSETQLAEEESGYAGEEWAEGEWIQNEAGRDGLAARRGRLGGVRHRVGRGCRRRRRGVAAGGEAAVRCRGVGGRRSGVRRSGRRRPSKRPAKRTTEGSEATAPEVTEAAAGAADDTGAEASAGRGNPA